jgi:HSP20 family molecular chaperone IbpA
MNHLFEQMMPWEDGEFAFMPSVEIDETPHEIHLQLEVPGVEFHRVEAIASNLYIYFWNLDSRET